MSIDVIAVLLTALVLAAIAALAWWCAGATTRVMSPLAIRLLIAIALGAAWKNIIHDATGALW